MLDPKILRQNLEHVVEKLRRRGFEMDSDTFLQLENKRKEAQLAIQSFQTKRNQLSKTIGMAKSKGENPEPLMAEV
ncbi:serine--tRNA ligase, partial [Coxiella burnetii]